MRQLIGAMCAAVLALPAFAAPDPSATATRADLQTGTLAPPALVPAPTTPYVRKRPAVVEH